MPEFLFDLANIGFTAEVAEAMRPWQARGLEPARVSAVYREQYRLYTAAGEVKAEAIGALLYRVESAAALPLVGDWVAAQSAGPGEALVHAVLPRRTLFSRRAPGAREQEQPIAANIDLLVVVCGLDGDYNPRRIERYLTLARQSGAGAAVVLNKADVCVDAEARRAAVQRLAGGASVLAVCAQTAEGIARLAALTAGGRTLALVGSSGAGKSTIVNGLVGYDRQRTAAVREDDGRGRHTTTARELLPLAGGGALIDTPGMRELQLWAGEESVDGTFDDIVSLARLCRFRDCGHAAEDGCAVRAALEAGSLDPGRWRNYLKLRSEIAWHARRIDMGAALAERQKWKKIHKALRHHHKQR